MTNDDQTLSSQQAEARMAAARTVFDRLTEDGAAGQMLEQGGDNYYESDPIENRNFNVFLDAVTKVAQETGNSSVLVAGCGDGLETEILCRRGLDVTVFDYSANMVAVTGQRLFEQGLAARLLVSDVTNLDLSQYKPDYAGVVFAQVGQFIPVVKDDALMKKAIADLSSVARSGAFYMTTTQYQDPAFSRTWSVEGQKFGETTYFNRPLASLVRAVNASGIIAEYASHFDAGPTPPDDYKNHYVLGLGRGLSPAFTHSLVESLEPTPGLELPTGSVYREAHGQAAVRALARTLSIESPGPGISF